MVGGADAGEAFGGVGACGDVCAVEAADEGGEVWAVIVSVALKGRVRKL